MKQIRVVRMKIREVSSNVGDIIFKNNSAEPLIVLCPAPTLDYTAIIFFPPRGHYFAAAGIKYQKIGSALHEYTGDMVKRDDLYKSFLMWMRHEGIKKDFVPRILFGLYAMWGAYGSALYKPMGKNTSPLLWDQMIYSVFVENKFTDLFVEYFCAQIEQFGCLAFAGDICAPLNNSCNEIYIFDRANHLIDFDAYCAPLFKSLEDERAANQCLAAAIEYLESGKYVFPKTAFPNCVKFYPKISLLHAYGDITLARDRSLLRSKLISLLDFPWIYPEVSRILSAMRNEKAADAVETLGEKIYEKVVSNLDSFVQKIRTKYPIVDASPLTMPVSN